MNGYLPHIIAFNTWQGEGAPPPPANALGMRYFEVVLPNQAELSQVVDRVRVRKAHQGAIQSLKLSPDGRLLASCGDDSAINLWELESGERLSTLQRDRPYERLDISGVQGLTGAQRATLRALGAIEEVTLSL